MSDLPATAGPKHMTQKESLDYALEVALDLGDPEADQPLGSQGRAWHATVVRLTMDGWTERELADAFGTKVQLIKDIKASPAFLRDYSMLAAKANNRSVSVRRRIEALAHVALDRDAEVLALPVDVDNPQITAIVARKSDEIKDRHGDMPKKVKNETDISVHLSADQIFEINADAEAIPVIDIDDVESLIDGDPLEALYADASHLLEDKNPHAEK